MALYKIKQKTNITLQQYTFLILDRMSTENPTIEWYDAVQHRQRT